MSDSRNITVKVTFNYTAWPFSNTKWLCLLTHSVSKLPVDGKDAKVMIMKQIW